MTRSDVLAKLREANVLAMTDVRAVVLETTGDISVLHGDAQVDDILLAGVRGASVGSGDTRAPSRVRAAADSRRISPAAPVTRASLPVIPMFIRGHLPILAART